MDSGKREMALCVTELRKVYGGKVPFTALNGVSFAVQTGEILGLLGPNGAGKSTTIQMLLGVLAPTSGEIRYFGELFTEKRVAILERVGYANGYGRMPGNLSVTENLDVHGRLYGLARAKRQERVKKFLRFFGMWNMRDRLMTGLSAGQVTRVMLCKAFLAHPELVLLDEPTAALDPDVCVEVRAFVKAQRAEYGVSMIYTSHNMVEVTEVCDRVVFLKAGRIVAVDTPQRLAEEVAEPVLRLWGTDVDALCLWLTASGRIPLLRDESVEIALPSVDVAPLLAALSGAGIQIRDVELRKPSLEDYFLRLTVKEEREAA